MELQALRGSRVCSSEYIMNDRPIQIEDDQGTSCHLLPCDDRHIDTAALLEIHKLEPKGLLSFDYRSYDDPPCILWRTTDLISLEELFSRNRADISLAVHAAILLDLCELLQSLPGLPILKKQILWLPELIFVPRIPLSELEERALARLSADRMPSDSIGSARTGLQVSFLCVPWIPASVNGDQAANDVLGWMIGFYQRSLETLPEGHDLGSEVFTPPYNPEAILTSVQMLLPELLRRSARTHRDGRRAPKREAPKAAGPPGVIQSLRAAPASLAALCKRNRQVILIALAGFHLMLAAVVMLLFRHVGTALPDLPKGDLIARFPGMLKPGMRGILQGALALTLTADLSLMLYNLVQKKREPMTKKAPSTAAGLAAAGSAGSAEHTTSDVLFDELSLQPEDAISFAKLTICDGQRRIWRHSESKGLSEKGQAFITVRDYYVGSDAERADLFIDHPGITPLHARIFQRQGQFYITDLAAGSRTLLEGRTLVRFEDYVLPPSCTLTFGKLEMRFESSEATGKALLKES